MQTVAFGAMSPSSLEKHGEHEAGHRLIALSSGLAGGMQTKCVLSELSRTEPAAEPPGKYSQSTQPWVHVVSPAQPGACFWSGSQLCREWTTHRGSISLWGGLGWMTVSLWEV